jgi:S1-C subfamily serine protease
LTAKSPVQMKIFRAGQELAVELTPIEFPQKLVDSTVWDRLGLRLKQAQGGMVITAVRPGTPASRVGLEPGDAVVRVNQMPVGTPDAFKEAIVQARGKQSVLLLVKRGGRGYYLTLPF